MSSKRNNHNLFKKNCKNIIIYYHNITKEKNKIKNCLIELQFK